MINVLLISNDKGLCDFCRKLHGSHFSVACVSPFSEELGDFFCESTVILFDFDIIINGYNSFYEQIYEKSEDTPVLSLVKDDNMVVAMRLLQYNYEKIIPLPCCIEYLRSYIVQHSAGVATVSKEPIENEIISSLIGVSDEMMLLKRKLLTIAKNDLSVLILGETGTGKSFIARLIHQLSARSKNNFVEENVAAIQETLIEGELFGTKVGAYTGAISRIGLFEHAHKGTLFLDEISCIKNTIQAKLLQVLETGVYRPVGSVQKQQVDVRLISATNMSLELLKRGDVFRDDLYYRLSGVQLHVPALRNRKIDIIPLANYFLSKVAQKHGVKKSLHMDATAKLLSHDWPGNVRELERCIECAYFMTSNTFISGSDISFVS